jgi:Tol biopolymer transport system component
VEPTEFEDQPAGSDRFRSLRPLTLASIAVVAALLAGGTTYAFAAGDKAGDDKPVVNLSTEKRSEVTADTRPAVTPETIAPSVSTTAPVTVVTPTALPSFTVATSKLNRIVLIDTATGKTTKVLESWAVPDEGLVCSGPGEVSLSPDRQVVYYALSQTRGSDCISEIHAMTVDGANLGIITNEGQSPSISPDGKSLAFARIRVTPSGSYAMQMLVMDLATKKERVVKDFVENVYSGLHTTWSPDGKTLVYQAGTCGCGDFPWTSIESIDLASGTSRNIFLVNGGETTFWSRPSFLPDGTLALIEQGGPQFGDEPADRSGRIISVDVSTGAVKREIARLNTGSTYDALDVDASGKYFTFVSDEALMKVTDGGNPKGYASGVWSVAW